MDATTTPRHARPTRLSDTVARVCSRLEDVPDRQAEIEERERKAEVQRRLAALWAERGERYSRCTLDNFEVENAAQKAVLEALRSLAAHLAEYIRAGHNLIANGPPGTGKDHAMTALMRLAIEAGLSVTWTSGPRLFAAWRDRIDSDAGEEAFTRKLVAPDVLAISDPVPPYGSPTPWQAAKLYELIDARYSRRRAVWVTMNCGDREEAAARLGEAVLDRLRHDATTLTLDWPSFRRPAPAEASR